MTSWFNRWTKHMRLDPEIWGVTLLTVAPVAWLINYSWRQSVIQPDLQNQQESSAFHEMAHDVGQQVMDARQGSVKVRVGKTEDPLIESAQVVEERSGHQNIRK